MPDIKNLIWMAGIGLFSIVGTLVVTSLFTSVEDGSEALEAERITTIVENAIDEKMNVVLNGQTYTYGEAFSLVYTEQVAITAAFKVLTDE
jgi:hypothetical protein